VRAGVSAGQSTAVIDTLLRALATAERRQSAPAVRGHRRPAPLDKVIEHRSAPHRPHAALEPSTYTASHANPRSLREPARSKARGYKPGRYSSTSGGRCEACQGAAYRIEMHFRRRHIECEACGGQRYNRETLE